MQRRDRGVRPAAVRVLGSFGLESRFDRRRRPEAVRETPELPPLHLQSLRATPVVVPLRRRLATRVAVLDQAPLVLLDLETVEGVVGRAYVVAYHVDALPAFIRLFELLERRTVGARLAPAERFDTLRRELALLGRDGLLLMALSGFDMAAWDALARAVDSPLWRLLGPCRDRVAAYNSDDLGLDPAAALAERVPGLLERGFRAVKLRLGREHPSEDVAAVDAVRAALPPGRRLMVDYNQSLDAAHARERAGALDDHGLEWIEEPLPSEDHDGCRRLADALSTPIQTGENFYGPEAFAAACAARASDLLMADVQRVGGVTGWLRAAEHAARAGTPLSSHLLPEFSAHLLCATPTAHWLEYVSWAEPVLADPLRIENGDVLPAARPGAGLDWDATAVRRFRVDA